MATPDTLTAPTARPNNSRFQTGTLTVLMHQSASPFRGLYWLVCMYRDQHTECPELATSKSPQAPPPPLLTHGLRLAPTRPKPGAEQQSASQNRRRVRERVRSVRDVEHQSQISNLESHLQSRKPPGNLADASKNPVESFAGIPLAIASVWPLWHPSCWRWQSITTWRLIGSVPNDAHARPPCSMLHAPCSCWSLLDLRLYCLHLTKAPSPNPIPMEPWLPCHHDTTDGFSAPLFVDRQRRPNRLHAHLAPDICQMLKDSATDAKACRYHVLPVRLQRLPRTYEAHEVSISACPFLYCRRSCMLCIAIACTECLDGACETR